ATEVVVGGLCYSTAASAGMATGGAGFGAATGCGALAGAASSAVGNMLSDSADHSIAGQLGEMAEGAIWGAVSGATGYGFGKVLGKCHSFLPGTGVLLGDGAKKAIEDVVVGDVVVTTNPETGETVEKPVVETITTEDDKDFTEISISVDGDYSSIVATDTHPFWVPDLKKWVKAGALQLGQTLRTSAGTHVQITAVTHYTKRQRTHDLTIEDIHAYYVLAGATAVLVHNCGPYGGLDEFGRATGIRVTLTADNIGGKTNPQVDPIGWVSGKGYNRAHLWGAQLGGSNADPRNFVTMHQYANTPVMRAIEGQVRRAVERGGQTVRYSATPIYAQTPAVGPVNPYPLGVTIRATGSGGLNIYQTILNRPKP
ncbi:polymorphic toxin-type HINT domain-containing protein, partial [Streptomyces sp. ATMOS53]